MLSSDFHRQLRMMGGRKGREGGKQGGREGRREAGREGGRTKNIAVLER